MNGQALAAVIIAGGCAAAHAADGPAGDARTVPVCSAVYATTTFASARLLASAIFAGIGVKLEWHDPQHCPSNALWISFSAHTPERLKPGAWAYALPFEGTHIVVFLDRIERSVPPQMRSRILGHVFAHEITHILQGCNHHADSGLMKAQWDEADLHEMFRQTLPFTTGDITLIWRGLSKPTSTGDPGLNESR